MSADTPCDFYVAGGTLRQDAPSYVERRADRELLDSLMAGEFCYVLTPRQMGKSSLMVHTAACLRRLGATVAVLDLTLLGQNLSPEQWYGSLLARLGQQLDLEDELDDFWLTHDRLSPLQRWIAAVESLVSGKGAMDSQSSGGGQTESGAHGLELSDACRLPVIDRLVIFIDEIDVVRALPFSTDEFFAALRACYNRRSEEPRFQRLAVCLLGVATPSDLIRDTRLTPFNIGRRIELTDFTAEEAAPLAVGLVRADHSSRLLQRILYWTNGHPYLTQRLCQAVAAEAVDHPEADVDRLCHEWFLTPRAQERDDNLLFVRDRLLRSEGEVGGLLHLYEQVRRGRRVPDDELDPFVARLRLSGIVSSLPASPFAPFPALRVRNRIYARVFDQGWVGRHKPGAELRRQREAYRQGLLRAAAISTLVLVAVGGLALFATKQASLARQQARLAAKVADDRRRHLYTAQMNVAQQAWEGGNLAGALELLDAWRPHPGEQDLRGFEWRYLWRLCQGDQRFTFHGQSDVVNAVGFSPDGKLLAAGSDDNTLKLYDVASHKQVGSVKIPSSGFNGLVFSPDGGMLATSSGDGMVRLWDVIPGRGFRHSRWIATLAGHSTPVGTVAFSPDGKLLASDGIDNIVRLWNIPTRRMVATIRGPSSVARHTSLAYSPDGKTLALGGAANMVQLWDVASRREVGQLRGHANDTTAVRFSPDGQEIASAGWDGTVRLWNTAARRPIGRWNRYFPWCLAFSPDGRKLAAGSDDGTIRFWDIPAQHESGILRGHKGRVLSVAFSPNGKLLASGGADRTVRLWDTTPRETATVLKGRGGWIWSLAFSPDGRTLASAGLGEEIRLRRAGTWQTFAILKARQKRVFSLTFSPDGRRLAAIGADEKRKESRLQVWDLATKRSLAGLTHAVHTNWLNKAVFSPDGRFLAAGGVGNSLKLWAAASGREVASLTGHTDLVSAVAYCPDGKTIATGCSDGAIKLWDVASRQVISTTRGHQDIVTALVFSPDARILASSSWDHTVRLWDAGLRHLIATLEGYAGNVDAIAFSPDGKRLAAGCADGSVLLWDVATGQKVMTLRGHSQPAGAVAFSPDGSTLASAGADGTVRLWQAAPFSETDPLQVIATTGDRTVTLQWHPLPWALGYTVSRVPAGAAHHPSFRLVTLLPTATTFADRSRGLVNGQSQSYTVAPLYRQAAGRVAEGPAVSVRATPMTAPAGFVGCSIREGDRSGAVAYRPATREILLRGSGADIWDKGDECYFLSRSIAGDFRLSVTAKTLPTATHQWAQAGLMIRESLDAGSRHAALVLNAAHGPHFKWRPSTGDFTDDLSLMPSLKPPIVLRLTRRGSTLTPEYSLDAGRTFRAAVTPVSFTPPLPETLYAGLAITAHDENQTSEARFTGLWVESLGRSARPPEP